MKIKTINYCLLSLLSLSNFQNYGFDNNAEMVIVSEYGDCENIKQTLYQNAPGDSQPLGLGAASAMLLNALYQDVPVLIPAALWQNIVDHKNLFDKMIKTKNPEEVYNFYGKTTRFKTPQDLKKFQKQCIYFNSLYRKATQYIKAYPNINDLKQALWQDPAFDKKRAPKELKNLKSDLWQELSQYLICSNVPVTRYVIKSITIDDKISFYLFIPKSYLKQNNTELDLGLKIDCLQTIQNPLRLSKSNFDLNYGSSLNKVLDKLFIKKDEVREDLRKHWTIYIMGHGLYCEEAKKLLETTQFRDKENLSARKIAYMNFLKSRNRICGIGVKEFTDLLLFFEHNITMKILLMSSCSAGGKRFLETFSNNNGPIKLSYTVISDTLTEAPSICLFPYTDLSFFKDKQKKYPIKANKFIDKKNKCVTISSPYNLKKCFALCRKPQTVENINKLVNSICPVHQIIGKKNKRIFASRYDVNNIPSVRLPNKEYFCAIDPEESFCSIKTDINNSGLNIDIPEDKKLVLLCSSFAPKLTVKKAGNSYFPWIVSMIPGKAHHKIEEINAPQYKFSDIMEAFFPCEKLETSKLIFIKKLYCINNIDSKQNKKPAIFENVILFNGIRLNSKTSPDNKISGFIVNINEKALEARWPYSRPFPENVVNLIKPQSNNNIQDLLTSLFQDANTHEQFARECPATISLNDICSALAN